jgi:hypothetical protein
VPYSLVLELVRQMARWLVMVLLGFGVPDSLAKLVENPELVANVAAALVLALSEGGWVIVKFKQFKTGWGARRAKAT